MASDLVEAVALLVCVLAVLVILPKLLWRDWTRNSTLFGGGGGRKGGGFLGALAISAVVRAVLTGVVAVIGAVVSVVVVPLLSALGRGAGGAWRWGLNESARRSTRRDPDGLEDLWRRS